jgi:hypothetical protein
MYRTRTGYDIRKQNRGFLTDRPTLQNTKQPPPRPAPALRTKTKEGFLKEKEK